MEREERVTRRRVTERPDEGRRDRSVRGDREYRDTRDSGRSETDRGIREVRDAGSDMWSGSCRLLSDLFNTIGDAFAPRRGGRTERESGGYEYESDDEARGAGDCIEEIGIVCRSFNRSGGRSEGGRGSEGGRASERGRTSGRYNREQYYEDDTGTDYASEKSTTRTTTDTQT